MWARCLLSTCSGRVIVMTASNVSLLDQSLAGDEIGG